MSIIRDLTNQKFGRLTLIKRVLLEGKTQKLWMCRCDCGKIVYLKTNLLTSGNTKSCGCLRRTYVKHGMSGTRINKIYMNMKSRCYTPSASKYYLYGGKGIKICDEWLDKENGFMNFYNWAMQNGYKDDLTIDRIDSDKNYEPNNCRWATYKEQNSHLKNHPSCKKINYNGESHSLKEWSIIKNISYNALLCRYERKWDIKRMLETPTGRYIRSGKYLKEKTNGSNN